MLMMGIGSEIQLLVMSGVVVAELQLLANVHVLIDVKQTLHGGFDVDEFPQVQHGAVYKVDLTTDKSFVSAPLIVGYT
jgi:hypothetical protein